MSTYFWGALIVIAALILAMAIIYFAYALNDAAKRLDGATDRILNELRVNTHVTVQGTRGVRSDQVTLDVLKREVRP